MGEVGAAERCEWKSERDAAGEYKGKGEGGAAERSEWEGETMLIHCAAHATDYSRSRRLENNTAIEALRSLVARSLLDRSVGRTIVIARSLSFIAEPLISNSNRTCSISLGNS